LPFINDIHVRFNFFAMQFVICQWLKL